MSEATDRLREKAHGQPLPNLTKPEKKPAPAKVSKPKVRPSSSKSKTTAKKDIPTITETTNSGSSGNSE